MIGNVNFLNNSSLNGSVPDRNCSSALPCKQKIVFGKNNNSLSPFQGVKDIVLTLTDDLVGLAGFNTALWAMQKFVSNDILIGKINEHFTKNIKNTVSNKQLVELAAEMTEKHNLLEKVSFDLNKQGQAYFTHEGNQVVVGKDKFSTLFHEIGHAVEENNTTLLKQLQRGRGHYTAVSLALYTLLAQRKDNSDGYISKSDAIIPLLAYSPELITEAKASQIGLKFLKEKLNAGKISKELYKNIKRSYLTCFGTYLFVPVSIILLDLIRNGANKARQRRYFAKQNQFYA